MSGMPEEFEKQRSHLEGLAYRMLGSLAEAQDVVQETYLRWSRVDRESIVSPRAWLVTACSRIALDVLKSARMRREIYPGPWLPEPWLSDEDPRPDERAELDDSVSLALMVALEKLSPAERAVLLLHDVFAHSMEEVGEILGKSASACRQLASRARKHIRSGKPRFQAKPDDHRRLLGGFLEAARAGDESALKEFFSDSVTLHSDGGGKAVAVPKVLAGVDAVSRFFSRVMAVEKLGEARYTARSCWFNGAPGMLVFENGSPVTAFSLKLGEHGIEAIYAHRNPDKLEAFQSFTEES